MSDNSTEQERKNTASEKPDEEKPTVKKPVKRSVMSVFEDFEGEVSMSDFTVEELERITGYTPKDNAKFKQEYFDYYDDVKSHTLKKQDW